MDGTSPYISRWEVVIRANLIQLCPTCFLDDQEDAFVYMIRNPSKRGVDLALEGLMCRSVATKSGYVTKDRLFRLLMI